jgi:hypothetical protein
MTRVEFPATAFTDRNSPVTHQHPTMSATMFLNPHQFPCLFDICVEP